MAKRPSVPKFGAWDDNGGYTVYFDRVREKKGATAPPLHRPHSPGDGDDDPMEGPMMSVPPPSSRPATSGGHREPQHGRHHGQGRHHGHRRAGSTSSAASEPGGRGAAEQSKFAPPPQYYLQLPAPEHPQHHGGSNHHDRQPPAAHGGGGGGGRHHHHHHHHHHHRHHHHDPAPHGGEGEGRGGGHRVPHAQRQQHGPRARSASPQNTAPGRQRPSAVPKFGVWDEQTAEAAAQGFTVQFANVKRHREEARAVVPAVPRAPSPPEGIAARRAHQQNSHLFSKMFGCFLPITPRRQHRSEKE